MKVNTMGIELRKKHIFRGRKNNFPSLFICFLMIAIAGLSTNNADYRFYEYSYNNLSEAHLFSTMNEIGYTLFSYLFKSFGFGYQIFLFVFICCSVVILYIGISRLTDKTFPVLLFYFIWPYPYRAIQLRFFISSVLLLLGISYLKEYNLKNLFKYLLVIIIATSMHSSSVIYLLMLLAYIRKRHVIITIAMLSSIFILIMSLLGSFSLFGNISAMFSFLGENWRDSIKYLTFNRGNTYIFYYVAYFAIILYVHLIKSAKNRQIYYNNASLLNLLYLSFIFIPLISLGDSFERYFEVQLPLFYIIIVNDQHLYNQFAYNSYEIRIKKIEMVNFCFAFCIPIGVFYRKFLATGRIESFQRVIMPLLKDNLLFK